MNAVRIRDLLCHEHKYQSSGGGCKGYTEIMFRQWKGIESLSDRTLGCDPNVRI